MHDTSRLKLASIVTILCGLALVPSSCSPSSSSDTYPYVRVEFVTPSIGWIVGSKLLQTTDGGKTWRIVREGGDGTFVSPTVVDSLHRFQFINQDVGLTIRNNVLRRTVDGGSTWQQTRSIATDDEHIRPSFFFISPTKGWMAGKHVYHTEDGGLSWQQMAATPTGDYWHQREISIAPGAADYEPLLWFNTANDGVMAKLDGMVQLTNDGGKTWQYVFDANAILSDVFFIDSSNGWIVGYDGFVARTQDGGRTWTRVQTPTSESLLSVHFINSNSGCAVGSNCTIICTKDGGTTWNSASVKSLPKTLPLLASVSFANELNGWAVGGLGHQHSYDPLFFPSKIALTTKDGGQTWEPVTLPD